MICTVKVKLLTSEEQHRQLLETMHRFNEACDYVSKVAWENKTFSLAKLHKLVYYEVRANFGLAAQLAVRAINKVVESYKVDKKTVHKFRPNGAVVYDDRVLRFTSPDEVSIHVLDGRIRVPVIFGKYQRGMVDCRRIRGQADMVLVDGVFYLLLAVELPDGSPIDTQDFIGVDLGIANIATTSDGVRISGAKVNNIRKRNFKIRTRLQKKGTKSAKRLLKKRRRKEERFARDVNHCISKKIVTIAKGTVRGIALEDLKGIRERTTVRTAQRREHSSWSFYQLRTFIEYKAKLAGAPVMAVDPRNTSRTCPKCGHIDKKNRKSQSAFCCVKCGFSDHADHVAAMNIRSRAVVNQPYAVGETLTANHAE